MSIRSLVAVVGIAGAVALPTSFAHAAEPLPAGEYVVALNADVSVLLDVDEGGDVDVDAPNGVVVNLEFNDEGHPLDEFDVVLANGDVYGVDIDAEEDGSYRYSLDAPEADDEAEAEESDDEAGVVEESNDATEDDPTEDDATEDEAPGQHGRDNAREHGGNANGFGAEGTSQDQEAKDAVKDERHAERDESREESKGGKKSKD